MIQTSTIVARTKSPSDSNKEVVHELAGLFGAPFEVFEIPSFEDQQAVAQRLVAEAFLAESTPGFTGEELKSFGNELVTVFRLPDETSLVAAPLESAATAPRFAVARVGDAEPAMLLSIASHTLRSTRNRRTTNDQKEVLDCYAQQLTQSFEELAWLRDLSNHLEQFEVTSSIRDVGETVLPSLQQLVRAQSAMLIEQRAGDENDQPATLHIMRVFGERLVSNEIAGLLIAELRAGGPAAADTVVKNGRIESVVLAESQGIRSILLTPVVKGKQVFGWLLLLNRRPPESSAYAGQLLGADEFGTEDAALAESAAVVLATHGRNVQLFKEREHMMLGVVQSLVRTLEARDEYTCGHSDRVAEITRMLAREMGTDEAECTRIYRSGLLHDIGKVGVPDQVLNKPGKLDDDEFEMIKRHPMIGDSILKGLKSFEYMLPAVRNHHERIDGRGYPDGLKGDEIPFAARVMAVADGFDAMTSNRPYRTGMSFEKAESILKEGAGTQWDSDVIDAYFRIKDEIRGFASSHRQSLVMSGLKHELAEHDDCVGWGK